MTPYYYPYRLITKITAVVSLITGIKLSVFKILMNLEIISNLREDYDVTLIFAIYIYIYSSPLSILSNNSNIMMPISRTSTLLFPRIETSRFWQFNWLECNKLTKGKQKPEFTRNGPITGFRAFYRSTCSQSKGELGVSALYRVSV